MVSKKYQFYCVKTCSTCRKAKAWLVHNGIEFEETDLLKAPPDLEEMKHWAGLAGLEVKDLINRKSQSFKKLKPDLENMSPEELAFLVKGEPRILTRPILINNKRVLKGFKEEIYQQFFTR